MKHTITTFALAAAACALPLPFVATPAFAQTQGASSSAEANAPSDADRQFVQAVSAAGATEIAASKLALHQSQDADVKSFARHMIMDHTKLALQLKMAAPHGVEVPKDNADQQLIDSLKPLKGKDFDSAYVQKAGVEGHKQAVQAFQDESSNGQNAGLKKFAQKGLPTIQHHYQMAQDLAQKKGIPAAQ